MNKMKKISRKGSHGCTVVLEGLDAIYDKLDELVDGYNQIIKREEWRGLKHRDYTDKAVLNWAASMSNPRKWGGREHHFSQLTLPAWSYFQRAIFVNITE